MTNITYTVNQDSTQSIPNIETFSQEDNSLVNPFQVNQLFDSSKHSVELHIYNLAGELQESEYEYGNYKELGNAASAGKKGASVLTIDPITDVNLYGYDNGGVKLYYNFIKNIYSENKENVEFFIDSISPDRTELKLKTFKITNEEILLYTNAVKTKLDTQSYFNEFRINLRNNELYIGVNIDTLETSQGVVVTVKLYEPLPEDVLEKATVSLVELVSDSIVYEVTSVFDIQEVPALELRSANFNIDLIDESLIPTGYYNHDTLLSSPISNTTNELYSLVNSKGVQLSINHSDYSNFIHFSSAQERLLNFKYKVDLIESYNTQITNFETVVTSSLGTVGSITYYEGLVKGIVSNFDHYESFLYYESGSNCWPKTNNIKPYINDTTSGADTWFDNQLKVAATYDVVNTNILINSIPTYLRDDPANENYITFIHMIGQHFDNMWVYAKGVSDKYNADNRLDFGISRDLIAEVLKNFGVKLYTSNKSVEDLFSTFVGQAYQTGSEVIGTYITGSITGSNNSIQPSSFDDYQREVYKRMYHNLPILLKSKGTERGLRTLINCYGIPSDILDIKIYGGRNVEESPFYGDYRYTTSSLDKIRLDNTGSIVTGNTLSNQTSIVKREYKYTDDLHPIEIGFSPVDSVDMYIVSKSLSTGSVNTFNIDDYLGDPRNLYLDEYYKTSTAGSVGESLTTLTDQIMSGSSAYNVQDFVRLIKFFDNTVFKTVKDFIPARSTADTGIIIKPHLLQRSKAKSVEISGERLEHIGSIDTAFTEGGNGGVYTSKTQGIIGEDISTSYNLTVQTPFGSGVDKRHTRQEASFDGELRNSSIRVTDGNLNSGNLFKTPTYFTNTFDVNRWLNVEGLCILNPYNTYTDLHGGIYYSSSNNTYYLDSGSWTSNSLFTGLSQTAMVYEITSSNIPTSSYTFPFNTSNYSNYSTHSLTALNTGVTGSCTSSVNIKVAICDIDQTNLFRSNVKNTEPYNITSWFVTGSQNPSSNVNLTVVNNTGPSTVYNNLLSLATAVTFSGSSTDTYTLTVKDTEIPLTCTYNFPITAGVCSVITSSAILTQGTTWRMNQYIGTTGTAHPPTPFGYGLAKYFTGIDPDTLVYRLRLYSLLNGTLGTVIMTPPVDSNIDPPTEGTGTFYPGYGVPNVFEYHWKYGPSLVPSILGNVALFKINYTDEFLLDNPLVQTDSQTLFSADLYIELTAEENAPECTPSVVLVPVEVNIDLDELDPCCFVADTLITLANYEQVRIDSIKEGDMVLSYNEETGEVLSSEVLRIATPMKRDIVKHTVSNGVEVEAVRNHPFWVVGKGWSSHSPELTQRDHKLTVAKLEEGDLLLTQEGEEVLLESMKLDMSREYEKVYNLSLKEHYTYYANSILVHNKALPPEGEPYITC